MNPLPGAPTQAPQNLPAHPSSARSSSQSNGHPQQSEPTPQEKAEMDRQRVGSELIRYTEQCQFPYISDISNYELLLKIGQGTFGEVFKARCKTTKRMVALKKILMENEKEGFPITALREVKMLQQLRHKNITELIEICSSRASSHNRERSTFYLVFTFCEHDLAGLLSNSKVKLSIVHIKTLMHHLLSGLHKIHQSSILHRDMKAANVLITRDGVLKLADFGLARPHLKSNPRPLYTNRVVTLWYRPPELLLGERQYGPAIDMWGAGCIMAEMWTRSPVMQGDNEQRQLSYIIQLCGSISPEVWPNVDKLPLYNQLMASMPKDKPRVVVERLSHVIKNDPEAVKLIDQLLTLDPQRRPNCDEALDHTWFFHKPMFAENVADLMNTISGSLHEYTVGRGAHSGRGRGGAGHRGGQGGRGGGGQQRAVPQGQLHDMVF